MGMDLSGPGGDFRFTGLSWGKVLRMATMSGWEPAGTTAPDIRDENGEEAFPGQYEDWRGEYCYNESQLVTAEDARNLADALERALPDIPNYSAVADRLVKHTHKGFTFVGMPSEDADRTNPFEWFSGGQKDTIRKFIDYCRAGSFAIG